MASIAADCGFTGRAAAPSERMCSMLRHTEGLARIGADFTGKNTIGEVGSSTVAASRLGAALPATADSRFAVSASTTNRS
jgi:hypothetical protein